MLKPYKHVLSLVSKIVTKENLSNVDLFPNGAVIMEFQNKLFRLDHLFGLIVVLVSD